MLIKYLKVPFVVPSFKLTLRLGAMQISHDTVRVGWGVHFDVSFLIRGKGGGVVWGEKDHMIFG